MTVLVVGAGMFGAATARHLAGRTDVTLIAAPEPPSSPGDAGPGPFSSHHDEGRILNEFSPDPIWIDLVGRTRAALDNLAADLLVTCGVLTGLGPEEVELIELADVIGAWRGLDVHEVSPATVPGVRLADGERALLEPGGGHFSPRRYVDLAVREAQRAGVNVVPGVVTGLRSGRGIVEATLHDGTVLRGRQAVLAAGSYTVDLLTHPPAWRVKSEVTVLAQLSEPGPGEPERQTEPTGLAALPCVVRGLADADAGELYVLPPIRYPDGRRYLKAGANTLADHFLTDGDQVNHWYQRGNSADQLPVLRRLLLELLAPALEAAGEPGDLITGWRTARCAESYTAHGRPYVDRVAGTDLYVVAGGNGHSAQAADAVGALGAGLVLAGEWDSDLPQSAFALLPENAEWNGLRLLRERRAAASGS